MSLSGFAGLQHVFEADPFSFGGLSLLEWTEYWRIMQFSYGYAIQQAYTRYIFQSQREEISMGPCENIYHWAHGTPQFSIYMYLIY